ncbi:hypothetical protein WA026_002678 [Henosepilachna vigintioctopunctata]|uniref:Uncharacterized protein n=1 Tax=Henosepilachna vigintioctopunctata TaxID=420089 RepID=A0AAW1TVL1_9CUCU
MEATPVSNQLPEDSGCVSGSFSSSSIFGSTPKDDFATPNFPTASRKRKFGQMQLNARRLQDVIESCPSTPQFSSTLNESLVNNLENIHIKASIYSEKKNSFAESTRRDFSVLKTPPLCAPATPEKRIGSFDDVKKLKPGVYNLKVVKESPVKEAHDILYANLKSNIIRKTFSPSKFRENLEKCSSPAKKCLFDSSEKSKFLKLFYEVTTNSVIMSVLLPYLSDGDLYRLSLVSPSLKRAILMNFEARNRFEIFMEVHRENKENYRITPPRSPEKCDSPPGSPSRFNEYFKIAKLLNEKQSLSKCPRCDNPCIVDSSIGQCQNQVSCGYIYCLKCFSFSDTGPENFYDGCQSSALLRNTPQTRLSDMSNSGRSTGHITLGESSSHLYSIFHSPKSSLNFEDSSGFISENDFSPKPLHVKKNLSQKLRSVRPSTKVFHLYNDVVSTSAPPKRRPSLAAVPVIPLEGNRIQEIEPPSPPKVRNIVACSKQSKRNLKRLTR